MKEAGGEGKKGEKRNATEPIRPTERLGEERLGRGGKLGCTQGCQGFKPLNADRVMGRGELSDLIF